MSDTIIHISDLHFGAHNEAAEEQLLAEIDRRRPALCIVSGDFTQTGSREEFLQARAWLDQVQAPLFCVPGNHDIPRFQIFQRFVRPFRRYKKYITPDLCPVAVRENFVVIGMNSARPVLPHWNWAHGRISSSQRAEIRAVFEKDHGDKLRIFVCHHPLHEAAGVPLKVLVWGGKQTLDDLIALKTDLVLTGHAHHASVTVMEENGHRLTAVAAATAISTRLRHQENGYNLLTIENGMAEIDMMRWNGKSYEPQQEQILKKSER